MLSRHPPYILTGLSITAAAALIPLCLSVLSRARQPSENAASALGIVTAAVTLLWQFILLGVYFAYRITRRRSLNNPEKGQPGQEQQQPQQLQRPGTTFFNDSEEELGNAAGQGGWATSLAFLFFPSLPILVVYAFLFVLWTALLGFSASIRTTNTVESEGGLVSALTCVAAVGMVLFAVLVGWGSWKMFRKDRRSINEASLPDDVRRQQERQRRRRSDDSDAIAWGA
ncbi:hypothetical protein DL96DRAFT_719729 [Flagelloscypha sp. PMI_526]|nr:hypothetical protein DL96DRAFT_719729 [Flagelloscypha sp. PMI_526]